MSEIKELLNELSRKIEEKPTVFVNIKLEIQDVLKNLVYNIENESYELTKHYYNRLRILSEYL